MSTSIIVETLIDKEQLLEAVGFMVRHLKSSEISLFNVQQLEQAGKELRAKYADTHPADEVAV